MLLRTHDELETGADYYNEWQVNGPQKVQVAEKGILTGNVVWIDNSRYTGVQDPWEQSRRKIYLKKSKTQHTQEGRRIKVSVGNEE